MDWEALAQHVIDRRVELGYRTREAFAAGTKLSPRLVADIEHARRDNYDQVTFARLETALRWPSGMVRRILTRPPPAPSDFDEDSHAQKVAMLRHVWAELADLLDERRVDEALLDAWLLDADQKRVYADVMFRRGPSEVAPPRQPAEGVRPVRGQPAGR